MYKDRHTQQHRMGVGVAMVVGDVEVVVAGDVEVVVVCFPIGEGAKTGW